MSSRLAIVCAVVAAWCAGCQGSAPRDAQDGGADTLRVTVDVVGGGAGRITSTPGGLDCTTSCSAAFPAGTTVTLSATPDAGSAFVGWSGDCSGDGSCTISRTATLSAAFGAASAIEIAPVATEMPNVRLNADPMRVFIRQWVTFEARVGGVAAPRVAWSVQEGDAGGSIAADGTYTAPPTVGEYHVIATGIDDPAARGSIAVQVVASQDLYDYGGPILPEARVQLVWWGNSGQFDGAVEIFQAFLAGVNDSGWLRVLDQYMRGAQAKVTVAKAIFDDSPQPAGPIRDPGAKICELLAGRRSQPDPATIYALMLSNTSGAFDYHTIASCAGVRIPIVVVSLPSSGGAYAGGCTESMSPAERMLWAFSHELAETMTDPVPVTAWADIFGQELADVCAAPICEPLPTGIFSLNPLLSDSAHGCAP